MKYRKKPIIIEAYQTDIEQDIETLEGTMHASVGDYIITGVNGEKYPCKPDIFEKSYEKVSNDKKFCEILGKFLIEEFDTAQCHVEICWCGFAYNNEDIYAIISKHNANGIETIRFGNEMQVKGMKRSYYYKNLKTYQKW